MTAASTIQYPLLLLHGGPALSAFRIDALNARLPKGEQLLGSHWVYFAHAPESAREGVARLLGDVVQAPATDPNARWILPRLGTQSPWSSKATDIAKVCGLELGRIERARCVEFAATPSSGALAAVHDRMTESVVDDLSQPERLFEPPAPRSLVTISLKPDASSALAKANADLGLALSEEEIAYLARHYAEAGREPSDAELMMFAQINSEHCRHKIFNARFTVDGEDQTDSLFDMIRASFAASPDDVLSAYSDNAAVLEGRTSGQLLPDAEHCWEAVEERAHIAIKVETHNHPTAISPNPGAATGSGGEIRDEAATGLGGRTKAGLCGFSVSALRIPGAEQPWETDRGRPGHMASALDIMLEAPIGAASYNNEFGRPNLTGYFRSFEAQSVDQRLWGYHKPIMIAGGIGTVRPGHVDKRVVPVDAALVVLGGPAMLIGLGGGAASSIGAGEGSQALDFASVQRANPEMERRAQEVIDRCTSQGENNPILSIHDVGAGGISNALPEIVDADGRGGLIRLSQVHIADPTMSPMEIWCNESQERYVLAMDASRVDGFSKLCERERCPFAVVGEALAEPILRVEARDGQLAVDMPMPVLLGKTPGMHRDDERLASPDDGWTPHGLDLTEAGLRVLRQPTVASKSFLITIGDRCITGMVARDQMVGPWQVPVADVAVTCGGFSGDAGEAMAMGERTPLAILDGPASGRMAVGEALTNLLAADIDGLHTVRLSANWMAACGQPGEDARLYDTVKAVGAELCPKLGISIPVGKDSLSMRSSWDDRTQRSPVSLIVTAFSAVADAAQTLTPQLQRDDGSRLILVDLGNGKNRLGGSVLAQVYSALGSTPPDLDDAEQFAAFAKTFVAQKRAGRVLAWHDRSDGGLWACLCEMAFAGHCGVDVELGSGQGQAQGDAAAQMFSEELGGVLQVRRDDADAVLAAFESAGVSASVIGGVNSEQIIRIRQHGQTLLEYGRAELHSVWHETSWRLQRLRDRPECADAEAEQIRRDDQAGLHAKLSFDPSENVAAPFLNLSRPRVAILREQGINSAREMAWAFHAAGFEAVDVHMSDLIDREHDLAGYSGIVAPGGFSYGDVLGAGRGWAASIRFHQRLSEQFAELLARPDRFALGICNGCQMMAELADQLTSAEHWPRFVRNRSEQFEGRTSLVEIPENTDSILLAGMAGSRLPVALAHGEGRAEFSSGSPQALLDSGQLALRYVDGDGTPTERYPDNPNGSPAGVAGVTAADGRITIMMPHPERVVRAVCNSWRDPAWGEDGPWLRMFRNARVWVAGS